MKEPFNYEEKIETKVKVAFGIGNSAHLLISGIGLGALDIFYLKATNIQPTAMALSWLLFIVWNMINDPLIGILQDRTKTEIGRRIPYIRYGSIVYTLCFIWLWFPFITEQELLFLNHLLMLFLFDTVYSMMGLIFYSMPAEMAVTSKERGSIMIFSAALGAIGTIGALVIPIIYLSGVPDIEGFKTITIIMGLISGVIIFSSSYFIKENKYTLMEEPLKFIESIKQCFKNKPFLVAEIMIFAMVIMQNVVVTYILFLFDYLLDFSLNLVNIVTILIGLAFLGLIIWWIFKNIEKRGLKKMVIIGNSIAVIGFLSLLFLGLALNINQQNKMSIPLIIIPLVTILVGILCYLLLGQPLMGDCIDHDEVLTGKRRETTYSGVNALITKPAVSIGHALFLWIIAIYGYDEMIKDPALQPLSVATGVIIAFTLIPALCLIIGIITLRWYKLDGPEWQEQKKKLQEIHVNKELDFIEHLKKEGKYKGE